MISEIKFTFYTWGDGWKAKMHLSNGATIRTVYICQNETTVAIFKVLYPKNGNEHMKNLILSDLFSQTKEVSKRISAIANDLNFGSRWESFVNLVTFMNIPDDVFKVASQDRICGSLVFPTKDEIDLFSAMGQSSPFLWSCEEASVFFGEALREGRIFDESQEGPF